MLIKIRICAMTMNFACFEKVEKELRRWMQRKEWGFFPFLRKGQKMPMSLLFSRELLLLLGVWNGRVKLYARWTKNSLL